MAAKTGAGRIDGVAMGVFLAGVKEGVKLQAAAQAAGFSLRGFYKLRERDPRFDAAWTEASELGSRPRLIAPGNGRRLQLRRTRKLRFTEAKQQVFLGHFAGSCNLAAAAEAVGVCPDTVNNHRRKNPAFAAQMQGALEQGYVHLEEEAVRLMLEALGRMGEAIDAKGQLPESFDKILKLLAQWKRRDGTIAPQRKSREALSNWSFEEAMGALAKRLAALKIPVIGAAPGPLPSAGTGSQ